MLNISLPTPDKRYLRLALPAAGEGLSMIFLANIDIILVGSLGTDAIAAVSIFTQPRMMLLTLARSLAAVITLIAAEHCGRSQTAGLGALLQQSLLVWGSILLLCHLVFFHGMAPLLRWMGAEESYLPLALDYADIAIAAVFFTSLTALMQGIMLGLGNTGTVLRLNLQGNVLNIVVSAILIFGLGPFPALGVRGAALGTLLGTIYSLAATGLYLKTHRHFNGSWLPPKDYFRKFLPILGGVFAEQGFERVGMVIYTRMAAELGTVPYAVHAVCMNFCDFYYSFAGGLGKASMVLAGQMRGKGDSRGWQIYSRTGIKWGLVFSAAACLVTWGLNREILAVYIDDPAALDLGATVMIIVALVSFPEAHAMVTAGILRGSGKTAQVAAYSFVSITVLRPIVTWFFIYRLNLGLMGAWLALAMDQSIRAISAQLIVNRCRFCERTCRQ